MRIRLGNMFVALWPVSPKPLMPLTYMRRFIDDDSGYLDWLGANPKGFVINTVRNPTAGHIVLHRAKCGSIGAGLSHGSHWTTRSVKLCGERNELEAFAREDLGHDLRCCGLCLRTSAADRKCEAPRDSGQAKQVGTAHEAFEVDEDSEELVLTGAEAKDAWRPYRPWFSVGLTLAVATILGGWLLWHRSSAQLTFLGIGYAALFTAALIWRFGVIGFEYWTSGTDVTFTRRLSFVPREIATPVLVTAGLCFILAATSTTIGTTLSPVIAAGIVVWQFGQATWSILLTIVFFGMGIAALFSRKDRAGGGCFLALLIAGLLANYFLIRFTGSWGRQVWNSYLQPFRDMWHLLGG